MRKKEHRLTAALELSLLGVAHGGRSSGSGSDGHRCVDTAPSVAFSYEEERNGAGGRAM
jgi:hypothetical protein